MRTALARSRTAPGLAATVKQALQKADAIVVFGAAVWPDGPSATLKVRVTRAAELYAQGLAPTLLCTGGWSNGRSEAQAMRSLLAAQGVPDEAVIPDDGGVTTREALRSVRRFGTGRWHRVIAVSSPYHMRRIAAEARRQGVDVLCCPAPRPGPRTWRLLYYDARQLMREAIALPAYAVTWQLGRLLRHRPAALVARAGRHVRARLEFLLRDADATAAASDAIARRIKQQLARLSDADAIMTPASGLRRPVEGPLGSRFGLRHGRLHAGVDLRAAYGSAVHSAAAGKVVFAGMLGPYGNVVVIDHGGGLTTVYAHLAGFLIGAGDQAGDGQRIGYVGETGRSSGPHLHFEVRVHGSPVDPLAFLPGQG
ncbi:MAG: peptidoglycan DD-metalloendopeptidase family protein [Casimicrobiaceae bacterium]